MKLFVCCKCGRKNERDVAIVEQQMIIRVQICLQASLPFSELRLLTLQSAVNSFISCFAALAVRIRCPLF